MPRRRVNRRPQNTRQPFVDVDRSTELSNNSVNTSDAWRQEQDSGSIASARKPDKMEYNSQITTVADGDAATETTRIKTVLNEKRSTSVVRETCLQCKFDENLEINTPAVVAKYPCKRKASEDNSERPIKMMKGDPVIRRSTHTDVHDLTVSAIRETCEAVHRVKRAKSHNEFPALSPVTPIQCCVPVSSTSSPAAPAADTHTGYADFVFWKPQLPIADKPQLPMVEDEIAALLNDHPAHPVSSVHQMSSLPMPASRATADRADVTGGSEFNEFNYWRKPIVDFDVEMESLQL